MKQDNGLVIDIEATGEPWNGKIICISTKHIATGEMKTFCDEREEIMIQDLLKYVDQHKIDHVIAYNGIYDFRYIVAVCLKKNIRLNQFQYVEIIDVMKILKEMNRGHNFIKPGTLNQWSTYLLGQGKLAKGGSINDLLAQGRLLDIIEYNRRDVKLTYELWKRINQVMEV